MGDDFNISLEQSEIYIQGFILEPNSTFNPDAMHGGVLLPESVNAVRGVCLVVISVLGASFNIFMIVAIVPNRRLRTVWNILLVHLGSVGLLSSVSTTVYPAMITFHGRWLGGMPMCQAYAYITRVFTSVSVWTIAALSWDKYQTIASPLHHSVTATPRKMFPCFFLFWACGLALSLPPVFGANEFSLHSPMGICGVNSSSPAGRWYTSMFVCLSFIFPFCLMIYCYAHIFRIARTQSSRIAATMFRMVSVIQAPVTSTSQSSLSLRGTKAMGTILQLIGSFVLTYLPYTVIILYEVVFVVHANAILVSIATTLFLAAPFTHAAIYGIKNQILRSSFHRYTRRKVQHICTKDKRRGSVRSLARKSSTVLKMPVKCVVMNDDKQCILQRTVSRQGRPEDIQATAYENKATSLSRPQSFDTMATTNVWPPSRSDDIKLLSDCRLREKNKQIKEVSFSDIDDVSYIHPDLFSHVSRQEISYYSKAIIEISGVMNWEVEETSQYDQLEQSQFGQQVAEEFSCDTREEELINLYPIEEFMTNLDLRKSKRKARLLNDSTKNGSPKKTSKRPCQMIDQETSYIFRVGNALETEFNFEQEYDVDESQA